MFKLTLLVSLALLAGCTSLPNERVKDDPEFVPVEPVEADYDVATTGSMYQDSYANNLYSDIKAHRIGDIITVYLDESTSAKKKAGSSQGKSNSYNLDIDPVTLPGTGTSPISITGVGIGSSQTSQFEGDADADQSNSLKGSITVNVTRVLSNGNLEIRGEKWLMLNNGEEFVRIKGVIRSEDVQADNSISSMRVANARIQYGGTGDFANTQKQGWLTAFFNGPYWPF
ncbi:flagellar basal body L-ring protein FlgH [Psychromonas antarctica]|jgi:flagellar L-ring protein precursor FlgH|uniref:flagellar basal body L-ring protein FlgH n=1 Tax=Psychromonas antarctica TaxID=67573 RepID=UPI001EE8FACE|nr:flagellar basal body L-ring protein FlgH [Psychromonas antarctica]MCG6199774.1 flagellar basal body L-ring protein FlgH [Psychromonas antarctica]